MPLKLVVFDIAGTTVKDNHEVSKAFQAALRKLHYEVPLELIDPLMDYEKNMAIRQILRLHEHNDAKITAELVDKIHKEFIKQMIAYYQHADGIEVLPHVEETFAKLHGQGIKVGINTCFSKDIADAIIKRLHWVEKGLVDFVIGSDEVELGRPYPFMIEQMMKNAGIQSAREVAKVGDTEADVREGKNAGCKYVVGVTTGTFTRQELEPYNPTHIINDMAQLIDVINN